MRAVVDVASTTGHEHHIRDSLKSIKSDAIAITLTEGDEGDGGIIEFEIFAKFNLTKAIGVMVIIDEVIGAAIAMAEEGCKSTITSVDGEAANHIVGDNNIHIPMVVG